MTSIRLFILDELDRGEAHGHGLRQRAQEEYAELWTDIQVGGLYATLKRLAGEGLIEPLRTESAGNYPERTVYGITDEGRDALSQLHHDELRAVVFRSDPFDLALQRADGVPEGELRTVLTSRRAELATRATSLRQQIQSLAHRLTPVERHIIDHLLSRLDTEVAWHERVMADLPAITQGFADGAPA